jgi:hypothetical protein
MLPIPFPAPFPIGGIFGSALIRAGCAGVAALAAGIATGFGGGAALPAMGFIMGAAFDGIAAFGGIMAACFWA